MAMLTDFSVLRQVLFFTFFTSGRAVIAAALVDSTEERLSFSCLSVLIYFVFAIVGKGTNSTAAMRSAML